MALSGGLLLLLAAIGTIVVFVLVGLLLRSRKGQGPRSGGETQAATAQWTEGETTRLLSSAEVPGLYLLRTRFLSKAENVVYLLLKAAFPRHEIFARVRRGDDLPATRAQATARTTWLVDKAAAGDTA